MDSHGLSLTVLVRGGEKNIAAREYRSPEDGNTYIEGREGSEFILRIRNGTSKNVLAIPSVDGLSIIDGKPAGSKSGGYVLSPYEQIDIPGWKLDREAVAAFIFAGMKDGVDQSYVALKGGDTDHKGVIGVRFVSELPSAHDLMRSKGAMLMGSAMSASASHGMLRSAPAEAQSALDEQTLGAGFGQRTDFKTTKASFRRGSEITTIRLFYDDARGLKRRGIDVTKPLKRLPNPFPADEGCTPPPGWVG